MSNLALTWEYLTGYAVATDPSSRERAEWPPHPARLFLALAAAWFETEPPSDDHAAHAEWAAEGAALKWLESLGDPELLLPEVTADAHRTMVTVYVPVNDKAGPSAASLQSCPSMNRSKQPRTFPKVWVGRQPCLALWETAEGDKHQAALERLCHKVTRIGHSSSMVAMHLATPSELEALTKTSERMTPEPLLGDLRARSLGSGTLDMLTERYGERPRRQHAAFSEQIDELKKEQKALKGRAKNALSAQIEELEEARDNVIARPPVRPLTGLWTGYRLAKQKAAEQPAVTSLFDSDMLVLTQVGGPSLPVVSTLAVARALRSTIMSNSPQPVPAWVSGHHADGLPLRDEHGHMAIVPLPFVGHDHADGHLMGAAIVFPRNVPLQERGRVLGPLLVEQNGEAKEVQLVMGALGSMKLLKRDWQESRRSLDPEQWTALGKGRTTWATVTPLVLDRYPKADRHAPAQRHAWENEVRAIIREACIRTGLPEPMAIDVDTTSWLLGTPRAVAKKRLLRGQQGFEPRTMAALGDGFPAYPAKGTNAPRPQVHALIEFPCPIVGPVILGAGRFQGYGFCKSL